VRFLGQEIDGRLCLNAFPYERRTALRFSVSPVLLMPVNSPHGVAAREVMVADILKFRL
jgi:hypothetical protein